MYHVRIYHLGIHHLGIYHLGMYHLAMYHLQKYFFKVHPRISVRILVNEYSHWNPWIGLSTDFSGNACEYRKKQKNFFEMVQIRPFLKKIFFWFFDDGLGVIICGLHKRFHIIVGHPRYSVWIPAFLRAAPGRDSHWISLMLTFYLKPFISSHE